MPAPVAFSHSLSHPQGIPKLNARLSETLVLGCVANVIQTDGFIFKGGKYGSAECQELAWIRHLAHWMAPELGSRVPICLLPQLLWGQNRASLWDSTNKLKSADAILLAVLSGIMITHQMICNQIADVDVDGSFIGKQQPKHHRLLK